MKFYHIKDDFITFLRQFDQKVPDNKNESRPYVGVVLEIETIKYYAPFTSPKLKHKKMKNGKDFRKINNGIYGLLQNQYNYIKADESAILRTAENLRKMIFENENDLSEHDKIIKQRCCNLPLLEKKYCEYQ